MTHPSVPISGADVAGERGHAELGRDVVLWCFEESPRFVGRALARLEPA